MAFVTMEDLAGLGSYATFDASGMVLSELVKRGLSPRRPESYPRNLLILFRDEIERQHANGRYTSPAIVYVRSTIGSVWHDLVRS